MFKRLVAVLPVRDGKLVKSYAYRMWRPAGCLKTALLNLDRWAADEILVLDISGRVDIDPRVVNDLQAASISTPITYGGGIRSVNDAIKVLRAGADRILIETLLWSKQDEVSRIADEIGHQAIVAGLPVVGSSCGRFRASNPRVTDRRDLPDALYKRVDAIGISPIEEVLVTDVDAEGARGKFSLGLAEHVGPMLAATQRPVIWFGGIDEGSASVLLNKAETVGVAFANVLLERELALREVRAALNAEQAPHIRRVEDRHA